MANSAHVEWLAEGVTRWNKRRKKVKFSPDLSGVRFFSHLPSDFRDDPKTSRYFEGLDLSGANLRDADLSDLNFTSADFSGADLSRANLSKSNFARAKFIRSRLEEANGTRATFSNAIFEDSVIPGMTFSGAQLERAIFISVSMDASQIAEISSQSAEIFSSRSELQLQKGIAKAAPTAPAKEADKKEKTRKNKYDVFYATNRDAIFERGALTGFGNSFCDRIVFGLCEVIVPESHRIGSIGSPRWKRLLNRQDDRLKIDSIISLTEELYWHHLLATAENMKVQARPTIFVHGFNNSFESAVLRAAQIGYDLGIGQGIGLFSWASKGSLWSYTTDEATSDASKYQLAKFLESFSLNGSHDGINVIAHSMGCRCVLGALEVLASQRSEALGSIHQLILAAADVDSNAMPHVGSLALRHAERVTSYVSDKDQALKVSGWLHGFPRIGITPPTFVLSGMDTIIVNNLSLDDFSHLYVANDRTIISDMFSLLKHGLSPEQRHSLERIAKGAVAYWRFRP